MRGRRRTLFAVVAGASLLLSALTGSAQSAPLKGEGKNMKIVANVGYAFGTDMEFATIKGREYAFAASAAAVEDGGGLHVIDVTSPEKPKEVAWLKCSVYQGDVQLSHDLKTVMLAWDSAGTPESCLMVGKTGFMTIDITNPAKPKPLGTAQIARGSHNITAHPTKPYVYNSDSDVGNVQGEIEIWSIKNPAKPKLVNTVTTPGHSPHDISFNKKGDLAITAGVDTIDIFDTADPENPQLVSLSHCPTCSIIHDAKFTPDGKRVIVGDEAGGGLQFPCPGGALHFYDLNTDGPAPFLIYRGIYEPEEVVLAHEGQSGPAACTSHVFDISDDGKYVSISWYSAGTRYLDVSGYTGATVGANGVPGGVVEVGYFLPDGGSSWSSKMHKGPYVYSNDINRGFDVFKVTAK